jgi:ATP adenylyltransferase
MIVPNAHVASPEDADPEMLAEMAALRGPVLRALRRSLAPEGFNLGLNVGAVAGAGVADHLHEHVVPRWGGDANFMPILAATTVMPELIPVTYVKLRAELERELRGASSVSILAVTPDFKRALVDDSGRLPPVAASEGEPLWRAALRDIHERGVTHAELFGWAGPSRASQGEPALLIIASMPTDSSLTPSQRLVELAEVSPPIDEDVIALLDHLGATEPG